MIKLEQLKFNPDYAVESVSSVTVAKKIHENLNKNDKLKNVIRNVSVGLDKNNSKIVIRLFFNFNNGNNPAIEESLNRKLAKITKSSPYSLTKEYKDLLAGAFYDANFNPILKFSKSKRGGGSLYVEVDEVHTLSNLFGIKKENMTIGTIVIMDEYRAYDTSIQKFKFDLVQHFEKVVPKSGQKEVVVNE